MNEAILIEIATRFRDLEDAIEKADIYHAETLERLTRKIASLDGEYIKCKAQGRDSSARFERYSAETGDVKKLKDQIEEARVDLDRKAEACRDDMVAMQELIRKGLK